MLNGPGQVIGFNPYFSGCFSLSLRLSALMPTQVGRFQSLFFWMLLSKAETRDVGEAVDIVSILIFLDASL